MAETEINGGIVVHEFVGPDDGEVVVLTPGGRYSKDHGGVRPLAEAMAEGGKRVLLWDRPNCGMSDVQLFGRTESHMRAETLAGLLDALGVERVVATGGSGGARDMIVFTLMYPEKVRKLATWSIVGGTYSTMSLAGVYILPGLRAVRAYGIEGLMELDNPGGSWRELIANNPRNKDRLLAIGAEEYERVMWRWLDAFVPKPNEPIPGVSDYEFAALEQETLIIRGGRNDIDHPTRTSYEVHSLIRNSTLVEPPWPEDAWEVASKAAGEGRGSVFDPWVQAAPTLLEFIDA